MKGFRDFGVEGLGFRVWGAGFRVWGLGRRAQGYSGVRDFDLGVE